MTATINTAFISQFSANIFSLLEQKESKMRPIFPVEIANGEKHAFERLGSFTASEVVNRLQQTNLQDPGHSRRTATVRRYEASTYLDDLDKFKMMIDPTSEYAIKLARAHGRNYDSVILNALLGTAATGQNGDGSQAFDTSNNQIAHGSAGLTVAKLNQALRLLQSYEVDLDRDELVLIVNARGMEDLYGDTTNQLTSFDFAAGKPLAGDKLMFRGLEIVHCERIPDSTAGSVFRAIMCTKDALKVAIAQDLIVKVGQRVELNFAYQVSTFMMFGAVRMEENRVIDILFQ